MSETTGAKIVNYPPNSHKAREEAATEEPTNDKKVEKVIVGEVVQRKKPLGRRIADTFKGDDMHSVGAYILFEVMIPAAKTTISDAVSQGIERMMFGDSAPRGAAGGPRGRNYVSYDKVRKGGVREEPRQFSKSARSTHSFDEIVLDDRGEAARVLDRLGDLVDQYDIATVADLYELVGITPSFMDAKWGWSDLRGSSVRRINGGYLLDLPRTAPIN